MYLYQHPLRDLSCLDNLRHLVIEHVLFAEEDSDDEEASGVVCYQSIVQLQQLRTLYLSFAMEVDPVEGINRPHRWCPRLDLRGLPQVEAVFLRPLLGTLKLPKQYRLFLYTELWEVIQSWGHPAMLADRVVACRVSININLGEVQIFDFMIGLLYARLQTASDDGYSAACIMQAGSWRE